MGTEAQEETGGVATMPVAIGDKYIVGLKLCTVEKIYKTRNAILSGIDAQWSTRGDPDTMSRVGPYNRWTENVAFRATQKRLESLRRKVNSAKASEALRDLSEALVRIASGKDDDAKIAEAVRLGLIPHTQDKETSK